MIVAVGGGTGAGWMLAGLIISTVTMTLQIMVGRGLVKPHWPLWTTTTKAEQRAAVAWFGTAVVFCAVGLVLAT